MKRIAKFEKVTFKNFKEAWVDTFYSKDKILADEVDAHIEEIYNNINLPQRATRGSAGYDFYSPDKFILKPGESIKIPTGIRVRMEAGWVLKCYPRSGLGFKFRLQLDNTVGIIDSDYYYSDNEGHIFCKLTNDSKEDREVIIDKGLGFMQGIFVEYGITFDDEVADIRNGGLGSTS